MSKLALLGGAPSVDVARHVRWPVLGEAEQSAVRAVLTRGVLSGPFAPEVRGLEKEFAAYVGARHCLSTHSGTSALHMALAACGVRPGDEVIVPAFTFVATAMAVLHHNAIPVFVDIEPRTLGMDPAKVEAAITPRTRAIMPVHIHGVPCELAPIAEIARRRGLVLIEDAAQAHGAEYQGRKVGTHGRVGCFSLQSSKNLACGEGGLLVTDDDRVVELASRTRMFGEDIKPADEAHYDIARALDGNRAYDSVTVGWMYRMSELPAALARSQLRHLDTWNENARRNAARLTELLSALPGVTPPQIPPDRVPVFHKYRVRLNASALGVDASSVRVRDTVLSALRAEGVDAVLWQTKPVPGQTLFQRKEGFGVPAGAASGPGVPWSLGAPVSYELSQYPETNRLLDSSLCLFSHTFPLSPQPLALVEQYAHAFARVWEQLPELLAHQHRRGPPA